MSMKGKPMFWFEKWLTYITGETFSGGHLQEIGARIFNLERMYNLREGFTASGRHPAPPHPARADLRAHEVRPSAGSAPAPLLQEPRLGFRGGADPQDAGEAAAQGVEIGAAPVRRGRSPNQASRRAWPAERTAEMSITVELTYDMSKALGVQRFELEDARTVADVVRLARDQVRRGRRASRS